MLPIELAKLAVLQSKRLESYFKVLGRIGKGGVNNLLDKNTYALKEIELKGKDLKESREKNIERGQRGIKFKQISSFLEAKYLARLSHTKIIRYFNSRVEVIPNKADSIKNKKQDQEMNDFVYDRNNLNICDSQQNSRNDLENIILFKDSYNEQIGFQQNEQISYSDQENEILINIRGTRNKQNPNIQIKNQLVKRKNKLNLIETYFSFKLSFVNKYLKIIYNKEMQNYLNLRKIRIIAINIFN